MKISISGSGPVAISLTLFLRRQGIGPDQINLEAITADLPPAVANRSLALSQGSVQLLNRIITLPQGGVIEQVDIGVLNYGLHSRLQPGELGLPALGRVVRYADLWAALRAGLSKELVPQDEPGAEPADKKIDEKTLHIIADGKPGEQADRLCFDQAALTTELRANFDTDCPAPGIAYERFKPHGPIALLPLPEVGRLSLVWCMQQTDAVSRQQMSAANFETDLANTLGPRFAPLSLVADRFVTPLQRAAQSINDNPQVLRIGNAAQTLHPVAGQGMNLGLRDAFETAEIIAGGIDKHQSPEQIVRQTISQRRNDREATMRLTDLLGQLDERTRPAGLATGAVQSVALALLDAIGPLRRAATKRFVFGQRNSD